MEITNSSVNTNSFVNILTLRYDPSVSPNLPKKDSTQFMVNNHSLDSKTIEKLVCDSIEKKLDQDYEILYEQ